MGPFPADQDPHPVRPARRGQPGQQQGQLGDLRDRQPRVVDRAGLPGRVDRAGPHRLGQHRDRVLDLVGDGEPDRERQVKSLFVAVPPQLGQPFLGGPGTVAADQDRLTMQVSIGNLADRLLVSRM